MHINYDPVKKQSSKERLVIPSHAPVTIENVAEKMAKKKLNSARKSMVDPLMPDISNPLDFAKLYQKNI